MNLHIINTNASIERLKQCKKDIEKTIDNLDQKNAWFVSNYIDLMLLLFETEQLIKTKEGDKND